MISRSEAETQSEETLRRWLVWALRGDPAEARILASNLESKEELLTALTWIGAIQSS